ncbi:MAG: hypothetical protein D6705_02060 [Deltaproteobacteria bacterium]|nr:MAG: hypothetical protein D6705_02060 [Deltaproteobacteria bacterium]
MAQHSSFRIVSALTAVVLAVAPGSSASAAALGTLAVEPAAEGDAEAANPEPTSEEATGDAAEGAPEGNASAEGEGAEGEPTEGEAAAGEGAEGEPTEGEAAAGEGAEGESTEGETAAGEAAAGEAEEATAAEEEAAAPPEGPPAPAVEDQGPQRPEEPTIGGKPAKGVGLMAAGGTLLGLGVVGIVTTSLITRNCSFDGPLKCKYRNQDSFLIPLTAAPAVLGVILLSVGIGYRVRYKKWENWTPEGSRKAAVVPFGGRSSAGLAVVGRF